MFRCRDRHECYGAQVDALSEVYMAASGLPCPNGDKHYSEVVTMALCLIHWTALNTNKKDHFDQTFQIRIGIHSGTLENIIIKICTI